MAVNHFTLTLNGSSQNLSDATGAVGSPIKAVALQAATTNSNVVYVGGDIRTLTNTDYGFIIPVPASNVPAAPVQFAFDAGHFGLHSISVLGTNSEKLHVFVIYG